MPDRFVYAMCRARWPGRDAQSYHRKIDRLSHDDLVRIGNAVFGEADDVGIRQLLHDAVDNVLFNDDRTDVARLEVRDREFILTGGLSSDEDDWDPTPAYAYVRVLQESRVTLVRDEQQGRYRRQAPNEEMEETRAAMNRLAELLRPRVEEET